MSAELFLSLEPGDIDFALVDLSSIVLYDESYGVVKILHASLVDFLTDKRRSTIFYIDMASTCTDFVRRILQCIKGPDGIRAGDFNLFRAVLLLHPWVIKGQLRSDILDFDLDAYITAAIRHYYTKESIFMISRSMFRNPLTSFDIWMLTVTSASLEDGDAQEAQDRCSESFESRARKYQSDWRLQLLLILAFVQHSKRRRRDRTYGVPGCRCTDILLEMDQHDLRLVDRNALNLRHWDELLIFPAGLVGKISQDGDRIASLALHCMRFLSNPPKYSESNDSPEMGLIYAEWKATCDMALDMLGEFLQLAEISPELVQFLSDHDIDPAVQKDFSVIYVWRVDVDILAFLSRANACVNWRIISAIQRAASIAIDQPAFIENDARLDEKAVRKIMSGRLDQCCSNAHRDIDIEHD